MQYTVLQMHPKDLMILSCTASEVHEFPVKNSFTLQ